MRAGVAAGFACACFLMVVVVAAMRFQSPDLLPAWLQRGKGAEPSPRTQARDAWRSPCKDEHGSCGKWAARGECRTNLDFMLHYCKGSCGACAALAAEEAKRPRANSLEPGSRLGDSAAAADAAPELAVRRGAELEPAQGDATDGHACADAHPRCAEWGVSECSRNPGFMRQKCRRLCGTCDAPT